MNVAAIKIQSYYSGFQCRRLVWLQKGWKYHLGAHSSSRIKSKGDKKPPKSFLSSCATCNEGEDGVVATLSYQPNENTLENLIIENKIHSGDLNDIEMKSNKSTIESLDDDKTSFKESSEGQIHKCYEKNSLEGQIHLCESRQSSKRPSIHICYEKQSSQHQVHVCLNKQPLEKDNKIIQKNLKVKETKNTNHLHKEKIWNSLKEKDFIALLACNLKKIQTYPIHKSCIQKDQKVTKKNHSFTNICKLNVFKPSKCLNANAFNNCVACGPPMNEYHEDCAICYRPPIHSW